MLHFSVLKLRRLRPRTLIRPQSVIHLFDGGILFRTIAIVFLAAMVLAAQFAEAIQHHNRNGTAKIFAELHASKDVFYIGESLDDNRTLGSTVLWNPSMGLDVSRDDTTETGEPTPYSYTTDKDGGTVQSPAMTLLHEAGHAWLNLVDPDRETTDLENGYTNTDEQRIIKEIETPAARKAGEPTRDSHRGWTVKTDCVTCTTESRDQAKDKTEVKKDD